MVSDTEDVSRHANTELSATLTKIAEQSHRLFLTFLSQQSNAQEIENDPLNIRPAFAKVAEIMITYPAELGKAHQVVQSFYFVFS